jgi:hypothetical protein
MSKKTGVVSEQMKRTKDVPAVEAQLVGRRHQPANRASPRRHAYKLVVTFTVDWTRRSESDPLAAQKVIHLEA